MSKRLHKHSHSMQYGQQAHTLSPRMSSLPLIMAPKYPPPPIPLSQMSFEELMDILPILNAAIIAHDWVPCMQNRQQEIKKVTESKTLNTNGTQESLRVFNQDLFTTIEVAKDTATSYYALFDFAKELQNRDLQNKITELDDANVQRSEAIIGLGRHVSMHNEKCAEYEREIAELKDKSQQSIDVLRVFIHDHLVEALDNSPQEQIEDVLAVFMDRSSDTTYSAKHVPSVLYDEVRQALSKVASERDELKDVCSQQMATIREQSQELDQYIGRMARVISLVQEKEKVNGRLERENEGVQKQLELLTDMAEKQKLEQERAERTGSGIHTLEGYMDDDIWARDLEITNLRRKLEQAFNRERQLDHQLKQLVQSSQSERPDKRPNRLKRLLTGSAHLQEHPLMLPKGNSMLDLSYASFLPSAKPKSRNGEPPSPNKSGGVSPFMPAFRDNSPLEPLEMPPPHKLHNERSSVELPPRLRETGFALNSQRTHHDEIESAVSSRFQMPSNVRSAASTPRPPTPKSQSSSSNSISFDDMQTHSRPRTQSETGISRMSIPRSPSMVFEEYEYAQPPTVHQRILSGITEVSETETAEYKRKSGSPDSADQRMYQDSVDVLSRLELQ